MPLTKLLAVVASLASAVIVRDAAELRAALADGAPSIELVDDLYLEGEQLNVTAPCVVDGRGYVLHNDARHFRASASLDLRNVTLVRTGYAPFCNVAGPLIPDPTRRTCKRLVANARS